MTEPKLSVIIPSYKDPLLHRTVESILTNFEGTFEIIIVLDGYWTQVIDDPRVRAIHLGKNRGMRDAINAGVSVARGEYLMRTDEHCVFDQGFDVKMTNACKENEIMTAKRYFLDVVKWEIMDIKPVQYEKLTIQGGIKFSGQRWPSRDKEREKIMVDETMAMQGSCWVMPRQWWIDVIKELDTKGYGPLYQDSHEMIFKTWKAGGKMMLNKNTWFAHKHRSFSRTHSNGTKENPSNNEACWKYSLDLWGDYYKEIKEKWKI